MLSTINMILISLNRKVANTANSINNVAYSNLVIILTQTSCIGPDSYNLRLPANIPTKLQCA